MPDLDVVEGLAFEHGFLPSQWDDRTKRFSVADIRTRTEVENQHYELGFLVRQQVVTGLSASDEQAIRRDMENQFLWHETDNNKLACYTCLDIHHGLSLDIHCERLLASSHFHFADSTCRVPEIKWLIFHAIFKIYWEGVHTFSKGAYQYVDLCAFLDQMTEQDVLDLISLLEEYELTAAGHYVLRRLPIELDYQIPAALEHFLFLTYRVEPSIDATRINDFGDMWPKLWGVR